MNVPMWAWAAFAAVIVVMLLIDLLAHRGAHVIGFKKRPVERTLGRFVSRVRGGRHPDLGGELGRRIHHGLAVGEEPLRRQPLRVRPDLRLLQGCPVNTSTACCSSVSSAP